MCKLAKLARDPRFEALCDLRVQRAIAQRRTAPICKVECEASCALQGCRCRVLDFADGWQKQ